MNNDITKLLGQKVSAPNQYDPSILVREERSRNRDRFDITNDLFFGHDTWNGYESSALTNNGLPVSWITKVVYPSNSRYIVESKSMKLYWNSFNMTRLGAYPYNVIEKAQGHAAQDLSELLECKVTVGMFPQQLKSPTCIQECQYWGHLSRHTNYTNLEGLFLGDMHTEYNVYNESPDLLVTTNHEKNAGMTRFWSSSILRSNCKITHQPDFSDVYIYYKIDKLDLDPKSLLKYIVSFRNEAHFHEEANELIYKRIWDKISPLELIVTCFYSRRGGWDINPTRASNPNLLDQNLINAAVPYIKFPKQ